MDADDVPKLIGTVEPDNDQYKATEAALSKYLELAKTPVATLPDVTKTVSVGGGYPAAEALAARLKVEGDLEDAGVAGGTAFTKELSEGVKNYQMRHGFTPDGKLTAQTVASMNVPLSERATQLALSLERWRWLPGDYLKPRLMVNLPEFLLRGYDESHHLDFTMKVVVGKALGEHDTPVFTHMMKYLVFRPYWNVAHEHREEGACSAYRGNIGYLAAKNFEVTTSKGEVLSNYTAKQVVQGGVMVREKPGPKNSLGLVKFMFPNEYDIYLHSTPATELFNRTRRDFSHGCVRVQKPDELAAWVLQGQGDWDLDKVQDAMNNGKDNNQVNLKTPLPIVIFYLTELSGTMERWTSSTTSTSTTRRCRQCCRKVHPILNTTSRRSPRKLGIRCRPSSSCRDAVAYFGYMQRREA